MAAPRMDCHFTWQSKTVNGVDVLPPPSRQPELNFCGAHVTVETFEAWARLFLAEYPGQMFPTLSIQHMIDMLKDELAAAQNLNDRRRVKMEENTFELLITRGVTTKADYDAAPRRPGYFVRDVQGLHHFKIRGYTKYFMKKNMWNPDGCRKILDAIEADGPVHGWFIYSNSFAESAAKGTIFRVPREEDEEQQLNYSSESSSSGSSSVSSGGSGSGSSSGSGHSSGSDSSSSDDHDAIPPVPMLKLDLPKTHAVLLFGFGSQGRTGLFDYQNNWGTRS